MYEHILLSTDGSDVSENGLDQGLALAKALGARVTILTVTERLPSFPGLDGGLSTFVSADYAASQKAAADKLLAAAQDRATAAGVTSETVYLDDALPAEAIVETARARQCGLVVLASHGRRGLERLVLGSVTAEVVNRSPVPVLVVR